MMADPESKWDFNENGLRARTPEAAAAPETASASGEGTGERPAEQSGFSEAGFGHNQEGESSRGFNSAGDNFRTGSGQMFSEGNLSQFMQPSNLKAVLLRYVEISKQLFLSPRKLFSDLERPLGFSEPAVFLAVSALATGVLSAVLSLNLFVLFREVIFVGMSCLVLSGLAYLLGRGMGSKCTFEPVFRIFAFCSCLGVLSTVPGLNLLVPVAALILYFLGLREVLKVSSYQIVTITFLLGFMQILLAIGHMFAH